MNLFIKERTLTFAKHILKTKQTIRQTAEVYGISKSTVHFDVSKRLKNINYKLYEKVKKILEINFKEKHIRGGEATREKYLNKKKLEKIS